MAASGSSEIWIIATSSTGRGEAPHNAVFFEYLLTNMKPDLSNIKYTIIGLGDTNYPKY